MIWNVISEGSEGVTWRQKPHSGRSIFIPSPKSYGITPLQLVLGFFLAVILDSGIRGLRWYRLIYFMPVVTNAVAAALVFQFLLNRDIGVLAAWIWNFAEATGLPVQPPDWLNDPR